MSNGRLDVEAAGIGPPPEKTDLQPHATLSHDEPRVRHYASIDPVIEKRVVRKLDRVVVVLAWILCEKTSPPPSSPASATTTNSVPDLLAFLDRSNIGNAETAGMGKDLGFDDAQYQV